ncbi:hypothetical protein EDD85DRAFT_554619 [Armillaria nabsnona]|nr:hypothetical protein EDD85DRAFT_554619 [Armillaria nabsnona]
MPLQGGLTPRWLLFWLLVGSDAVAHMGRFFPLMHMIRGHVFYGSIPWLTFLSQITLLKSSDRLSWISRGNLPLSPILALVINLCLS